MKYNRGGFTIIETMIFLAVSGGMFAAAVIMLGGQQRSTRFAQSARQFESTLNDIINDTNTGVYPAAQGYTCRVSSSIEFDTAASAPGTRAGDNNDCIFFGKAVHFDKSSGNTGQINIVSVVGENNPNNPANFGSIRTSALADTSPSFDTVEEYELEWQAEIGNVFYKRGSITNYVRGFGVFYEESNSQVGSDSFISGAANTNLYMIQDRDESLSRTPTSTVQDYVTFRDDFRTPVRRNGYVSATWPLNICISDGGDEKAVIVVGNSNGSLTAVVNYDVPTECN